ncbi:MAG: paraquat-inducible protein A [Dinghuibacter sp.]|nr:paraquat-inducible protein A [Dinghuibacter sp.]
MLPADGRIFPNKPGIRQVYLLLLLAASVCFFILGLTHPILESGFGLLNGHLTINHEYIYLSGAFRYFFNQGDVFIGAILLLFTIILPVLKYIFVLLSLLNIRFRNQQRVHIALDIINKWSMLDVFVVALIILNMKFGSVVIISNLKIGTTYFAISVVLLMICSGLAKYQAVQPGTNKNPG